jgi:hypothetical protein
LDDEFGMFAPERDPRSTSPWLQQRAAVATLEEIRYAEALRLQIRESYLRRRDPPPSVWMTGVD